MYINVYDSSSSKIFHITYNLQNGYFHTFAMNLQNEEQLFQINYYSCLNVIYEPDKKLLVVIFIFIIYL